MARPFAARSAPVELSEARERAIDVAYWRSLAKDLHLLEPVAADEPNIAARDEGRVAALDRDGALAVRELVDPAQLRAARRAVDVVTGAGWPRVFAWVYDAVWQVVRAPGVCAALTSMLGDGWRQLPGVWINHTAPVEGAAGWAPHIDVAGVARRASDGTPARLTCWLALTDATVDNGCIFYVPAHVTTDLAARFEHLQTADMNDVVRWLHHARPLQASAGTLLCWRHDVLHWGAVATADAAAPRLALAFEVAHEGEPLRSSDGPHFATVDEVSFDERLSIIGRGLLAYGKSAEREPFANRYVALGEELCDRWLDGR